jgi:acyl phosphate:glycerol-3-phosphate acyltransferase
MLITLVLAGYLVGSIPVAWLLTKVVTGQDLRELGSGNVGVLNTALSVHRWTAALVFLLEALKGGLAVIVPRALGANEFEIGCTVIAAFVGTRWTLWLRGRGGRGNTLGAAALAVYSPIALALVVVIYLAARFLTHSNFLAMRVMLLVLPVIFGLVTQSWYSVLFGGTFALLFLTTHRPETDDHLLLKARFPTLWAFLTAPKRK